MPYHQATGKNALLASQSMQSKFPASDKYLFCMSHECKECDSFFPAKDRIAIESWLRSQKDDDASVSELRKALLQHKSEFALCRLNNDEVITQVAHMIESGQLRICMVDSQHEADKEIAAGANSAQRTALNQVLLDLHARSQDFNYQGSWLRIVSTEQWLDVRKSGDYQIVPREEARSLLEGMTRIVSLPAVEKTALLEAAQLIPDTSRRHSNSGLLLLKKIKPQWSSKAKSEEAITPSQLRSSFSKEVTHWVRFKVVDDRNGKPLNGVRMRIRLPSGSEEDRTTAADGTIYFENVEAGTCAIWCELKNPKLSGSLQFKKMGNPSVTAPPPNISPPRSSNALVIAHIEEHKVKKGESLNSIATDAGMTWQSLAKFNWDTDSPKEINRKLYDEVGCTKTTQDGRNYIFDDLDSPGVIFVPKKWQQEGLSVDETHVISVAPIDRFLVILENEQALRIPEAAFEATLADKSTRTGTLGRSGIGVIGDPPPGPISIVYTDLDDVTAKSMAASVRKAFSERKLENLYRILGHSPKMIQRVIAAYETYFNDHTGKGFVEDVYQEVTDPVALDAVVGLMARAGIPTHEDVTFIAWEPDEF